MGSLIDTYADLLDKADISAYDTQMRAGKNLVNMGDADEDEEEALNQNDQPVYRFEAKICINQENDIVQLLEGFLKILDHCLGTKRKDDSKEEQEILSKRRLLGRDVGQNFGFM